MTKPKAKDFSISNLLDRMHRRDLPTYSLLSIAYLISFAWLLHRSGEVLSAAVGAIFAAWLVVIPVAIAYVILFLALLISLTLAEGLQAIALTLRNPNPKAR
jgi:hypothetical protein